MEKVFKMVFQGPIKSTTLSQVKNEERRNVREKRAGERIPAVAKVYRGLERKRVRERKY